jgi:hypothetical protein
VAKVELITPAKAVKVRARVIAAPMLTLIDDGEQRYIIARVGFLPPIDAPIAYFETTDGKLYRLPQGTLTQWAVGVVGITLGAGCNVFPCPVRFGLVNGRPWVELD